MTNTDMPTETGDVQPENLALKQLAANPNTLVLNEVIKEDSTVWQIHNCKVIDNIATQDEKLPFLYHYDALSDDIKGQNPLTFDALKQFETPMTVTEAAQLLGISEALIPTPWQVKITGTLVMFSERLQIALRVKFTNTAKERDPIYTKTKEDAIAATMKDWHFYGDVFVLNKHAQPVVALSDESVVEVLSSSDYQLLPPEHSIAILTLLEEQKEKLPQLDEAIMLRLA